MSAGQKKILVVDDSGFDRLFIGEILNAVGYLVFYADSGEQCLSLFGVVNPDLVIMDLSMPGIGGLAAIKKLRRLTTEKWVPILLVSGFEADAALAEALSVGANDFVQKPVRHSFLTEKIQQLLNGSSLSSGNILFGSAMRQEDIIMELDDGVGPYSGNFVADMFKYIDPARIYQDVEVFCQPVVNTGNGRIEFIDLKPRWRHARLGDLKPNKFLPVLEQLGYVEEFTEFIFSKAREIVALYAENLGNIQLLVHISSVQVKQLSDRNNRLHIDRLLSGKVTLVFSASCLVPDSTYSEAVLSQFIDSGFCLCMDDANRVIFKNKLHDRLDYLKIERAGPYIALPDVDVVNAFSHKLILDHVNDSEAFRSAQKHGIKLMQGDSICRALTLTELGDVLRAFSSRAYADKVS